MRVLISGAGIAGPSLAWFLAKAGARVTIVERTPTLLPHGQNVDIRGSAVRVLDKMGLLTEVRRLNTTEKGTQLISPQGKPFAKFPVKPGSSASFTSEFEILRGDLAALLYRATKDQENVDYLFDTTIKQVIANDENSVKVELSNGKTQEYDVLVAADGQWSKVRKLCFPADVTNVRDFGLYCAYCTVPRVARDNDWWNIFIALKSRGISIRPDPHGTVRASFTLMPCSDAQAEEWLKASRSDAQTQKELVRREFADAGWEADRLLQALDDAPDFYFQSVQQIKMSKWSTSRVVCLGDAAHAPTPLTGMGTSLAIVGSYVLAGELNKLAAGEQPTVAFKAYESALRPFVEEIQKVPSIVPGVVHPASAWKRWLLQTAMWTAAEVAAVVMAVPWLSNRTPQSNDEDFKLPHYKVFDTLKDSEGSEDRT